MLNVNHGKGNLPVKVCGEKELSFIMLSFWIL